VGALAEEARVGDANKEAVFLCAVDRTSAAAARGKEVAPVRRIGAQGGEEVPDDRIRWLGQWHTASLDHLAIGAAAVFEVASGHCHLACHVLPIPYLADGQGEELDDPEAGGAGGLRRSGGK